MVCMTDNKLIISIKIACVVYFGFVKIRQIIQDQLEKT